MNQESHPRSGADQPPERPGGARVLVVDDDPRNRRLLEGYLKAEGYQVLLVENGEQAIRTADREPPDVVLLDVMMPGLNGFEVCRILKSKPATRLTQVMMVTALDSTADRVEGLDEGADDYVTKPVRREEFLAKLRSLLRVRRLLLELEEARRSLENKNRRLEELEALKETLSQTLVHDLKNPLAVLMGNLELMSRNCPEPLRKPLHRCRTNTDRIHRMILDLLDVASLEEGRLQLEPETLDAGEMARAAAEEAEVLAGARRLAVRARIPEETAAVEADARVLRRVLDNLLANAVEHSPEGGEITVRVAARPEGIEISVQDQGSGIPEPFRERIFEKYARLDLRKSGISANRGLGLTFCRLAVEAHGGTIWVEDAPGGGALFRVLLPAGEPGTARGEGRAVRSA